MSLFRRAPQVPEPVAVVARSLGEKVLAWAAVDNDRYAVALAQQIVLADADGAVLWHRPWHEVDTGSWNADRGMLRVVWVDRSSSARWLIDSAVAEQFLRAFRERVQSSVVIAEELALRDRRTGRVAIRRDLTTGALFEQVLLGKYSDPRDPDVVAEVERISASLREQTGL